MTPSTLERSHGSAVFANVSTLERGLGANNSQWSEFTPRVDGARWHADALADLTELALLPSDWDGYGSPQVTDEAFREAIRLVMEIMEAECAAPQPFISPVSGGGIQLEWEFGSRAVEIEFLPRGGVEYLTVEDDRTHEEAVLEENDPVRLLHLVRWVGREE